VTGKPYPKAQQLARGETKYRRKVASPKQWQALKEAKRGSCRVCGDGIGLSLHHVVPRDFHGDDLADNLVPLHFDCHLLVTMREPEACRTLCASLTDAEYAYAVEKVGEGVFERVYGIKYGRQGLGASA
jgi:5-methylcytosine-specific restriction endonuclease McrA